MRRGLRAALLLLALVAPGQAAAQGQAAAGGNATGGGASNWTTLQAQLFWTF